MRIGLYPGSFDPVTLGHLDIIKRSAAMLDELIIAVLNNSNKNPLFSVEERVQMLEMAVKDIKNVKVKSFAGLTIDFAREQNANILVRGLRAITDFEYELQIAQTNHKLEPGVDTMFLTTSVEYSYLSSSIVKEIARYGGNIREFLPECIVDLVYAKAKNDRR